jgi:hypothetical protein
MSKEQKTLTIVKDYYGSSERKVVYLDFNDGGTVPMFETYDGLPIDVIDRIGWCVNNNWKIEFEDNWK